MASKEELIAICQQAMQVLSAEFSCSQIEVGKKLEDYGIQIGKTTASKVLNGSGKNVEMLPSITKALQRMVKDALGMEWVNGRFVGTTEGSFDPVNIFKTEEKTSSTGFTLHKMGRLNVSDKVAFFQDAQHEVVEFGVKLNRFTDNIYTGGYNELRGPVARLLERGINFKCYLIDWDSQQASMYFNDRELFSKGEKDYARDIKNNLEKLCAVKAGYEREGYSGKFELYTYRHVPYNYFLVVDGGTENCKMMVSHYIFGVSRNKAPVFEFSRKHDFTLYLNYWESFQAFIKGAKKYGG